jgi:hypothetical protein
MAGVLIYGLPGVFGLDMNIKLLQGKSFSRRLHAAR